MPVKVKNKKKPKVKPGLDLTEAYDTMNAKFTAFRELVKSVAERKSRHLIARGDPGIGKSYELESVFGPYVRRKEVVLNKATGHMTPLAVYNNLFEYRGEYDVTMFDDCDSVFNQPHALNLLKAATDTRDDRIICWGSTSKLVAVEEYRFEGGIIILTNVDMRADPNGTKEKYIDKFGALLDRVIYFDLDLTAEEKVARILQILQAKYKEDPQFDEVCSWMIENYQRFGKALSIRSAVKLMELTKISPGHWKPMAEATILPRKPYGAPVR